MKRREGVSKCIPSFLCTKRVNRNYDTPSYFCLSGVSGQAPSNQSYFYVMFTILSVFFLFYTAKKVCFWGNQVVTMLNMFV